jgi:hypothetical protein
MPKRRPSSRRKAVACAAITFVAVVFLVPASAGARLDSGIRGRVTLSGCPGPTLEGDNCTTSYTGARIRVVRLRDGLAVKTFHSDEHGRFRALLRRGRYRLEPLRSGITSAAPVIVRVRAHRFTYVRIDYDRGLL